MTQNPEGAKKAAQTNLKKDPNYYSNLGKRNKGVKKSKPTGTQLMTMEERREFSRNAANKRWQISHEKREKKKAP